MSYLDYEWVCGFFFPFFLFRPRSLDAGPSFIIVSRERFLALIGVILSALSFTTINSFLSSMWAPCPEHGPATLHPLIPLLNGCLERKGKKCLQTAQGTSPKKVLRL